MGARGIFCFVLLVAFLSAELGLLEKRLEAQKAIGESLETAFDLERVSLARTLAENSLDSVARESLEEALATGLGPEETKQLVNSRLAAAFAGLEAINAGQPKIVFGESAKQRLFLNQNSSVIISESFGLGFEAEYCFTGGVLKDKEIKARIIGVKTELEFRVPAGYCIRGQTFG